MSEIELLLEQCLMHAINGRNLSASYVTGIRTSCRLYFAHWKIGKLADCTFDSVERWLLEGRAEKNWAPATFRTHHRNIGFLFRFLVKRGKMAEDPCPEIELPKMGRPLPKGLSAEEAEKVLVSARCLRYNHPFESKRNVAIVGMMLFLGLRRREVLNLRIDDVSVERLCVNVVRGKWNKDRIVCIPSRFGAILQDYLGERAKLGKTAESFFVTTYDDRPTGVKCIDRLIRRIREHTGIRFSAHSLRHTFATLLLEGGCDIYTLSQMMGHSKITTTTIYLACSRRLMASSIEKHPLN